MGGYQILGKIHRPSPLHTYFREYLEDPAGINLMNMTSDVLIETLEDDSKIINIWSEEPLNELITGTTIAGQR